MTTRKKKHIYDVLIIGGGAAGMMAAISCKRTHPDFSIAILDRTFALGRKILVSGGGRCNLTNKNLDTHINSHFHCQNRELLSSVFEQFKYSYIISFFEDLGIVFYEDRKSSSGKIFPITNQSKTITALLIDELETNGIDILLNQECYDINRKSNLFQIDTKSADKDSKDDKSTFKANHVILSAGSRTYPALGSNGSGYGLAVSMGHAIIKPVPSAVPLESNNILSHKLQGIKVTAEVTSIINGKISKTTVDDLLFTKYGLSGSAILYLSRDLSLAINRNVQKDCQIKINFLPGKTQKEVTDLLKNRWANRPDQSVEKSLFGIVPNKVSTILLNSVNIDHNKPVKFFEEKERNNLAAVLTGTVIKISGTKGWNEAEFTLGGVNIREITPKTLESQKVNNLYFCGEILDVDGEIGGYNLSWCWASGWVAGKLG